MQTRSRAGGEGEDSCGTGPWAGKDQGTCWGQEGARGPDTCEMRLERETGPSHVVRIVLWAVGIENGDRHHTVYDCQGRVFLLES